MDNVYVGKIVNTHGIKGEIRIISDFEYKNRVFVVGKKVIINNREYVINSYRVHKNFDMITFGDFNNINEVLPFIGMKVFVKREYLDLTNDEYLLSDLMGMKIIINNIEIGIVNDYNNGINPLLEVKSNDKTIYIPLKGNFIKSIDWDKSVIYLNEEARDLL